MAKVYAKKIRQHEMTLEEVPIRWREATERELEKNN